MISCGITSNGDDILIGIQHIHEEATELEPSFSMLSFGFLIFTISIIFIDGEDE